MSEVNELYLKIVDKKLKGQKAKRELNSLIKAFDSSIYSIISTYDIKPEDQDLLLQDGRQAVAKAVDDYKDNGQASFYTYAFECAKRAIAGSVRKINSKKNKSISDAITIDDNMLERLTEVDMAIDIEETYDNSKRIEKALSRMTKEEIEVVTLFIEGYSYQDIAKKLNKTIKDVDNIFQKIRKNNKSRIN